MTEGCFPFTLPLLACVDALRTQGLDLRPAWAPRQRRGSLLTRADILSLLQKEWQHMVYNAWYRQCLLGGLGGLLFLVAGCGGSDGNNGGSVVRTSRLALQLTPLSDVAPDAGQPRAASPGTGRQVLPGTPGFLTRLTVRVEAADFSPITASFSLTATQQEGVEIALAVPVGARRRLTVAAFNEANVEIFRSEERTIDVQGAAQTVALTLQRVLISRPALPNDLAQRVFVFPEGAAFEITSSLGEIRLAFGRFTGNTSPFTLAAGGFTTRGTVTLGSCHFLASTSDFPPGEGVPAGGQLLLDPCEVDSADGRLLVQHAVTGNRSISRPPGLTDVNDAPSFVRGPSQLVGEDAGPQTVSGWATEISAGPPDEAGQTLTFVLSTDNPALFSTAPALDPTTRTLTYTPAPDATGQTTVTVQLRDNGGTADGGVDSSAPQTFTIFVTPVNDAPVASSQTAATSADSPVTLTLVARDIDSPRLSFGVVSTPTHGSLGLVSAVRCTPNGAGATCTATVTYTPMAGDNGPDSFLFIASDGALISDSTAMSLTVNTVNAAASRRAAPDQGRSARASSQSVRQGTPALSTSPPGQGTAAATSSVTVHGTATFTRLELTSLPPTLALPQLALGLTWSLVVDGEVAAMADLNSDGIQDILHATILAPTVSVLLGTSAGGLQPQQDYVVGPTFAVVSALAVADLNDDGAMDVVTANDVAGSVSVLLGYGDGTFQQPAALFGVGPSPAGVAVGDVNGDDVLDLLVVDRQTLDVTVFLGYGDGTFGVAQSFAIGEAPTSVLVVGLDSAGALAVVVLRGGL